MLGAGSAGIDVADGLRRATKEEGLSEEEARSRFSVGDKRRSATFRPKRPRGGAEGPCASGKPRGRMADV